MSGISPTVTITDSAGVSTEYDTLVSAKDHSAVSDVVTTLSLTLAEPIWLNPLSKYSIRIAIPTQIYFQGIILSSKVSMASGKAVSSIEAADNSYYLSHQTAGYDYNPITGVTTRNNFTNKTIYEIVLALLGGSNWQDITGINPRLVSSILPAAYIYYPDPYLTKLDLIKSIMGDTRAFFVLQEETGPVAVLDTITNIHTGYGSTIDVGDSVVSINISSDSDTLYTRAIASESSVYNSGVPPFLETYVPDQLPQNAILSSTASYTVSFKVLGAYLSKFNVVDLAKTFFRFGITGIPTSWRVIEVTHDITPSGVSSTCTCAVSTASYYNQVKLSGMTQDRLYDKLIQKRISQSGPKAQFATITSLTAGVEVEYLNGEKEVIPY